MAEPSRERALKQPVATHVEPEARTAERDRISQLVAEPFDVLDDVRKARALKQSRPSGIRFG
jgi:hypothetical protein